MNFPYINCGHFLVKLSTKEQEVQEMAQVRLNKSSLAKDAYGATVNTATYSFHIWLSHRFHHGFKSIQVPNSDRKYPWLENQITIVHRSNLIITFIIYTAFSMAMQNNERVSIFLAIFLVGHVGIPKGFGAMPGRHIFHMLDVWNIHQHLVTPIITETCR